MRDLIHDLAAFTAFALFLAGAIALAVALSGAPVV